MIEDLMKELNAELEKAKSNMKSINTKIKASLGSK